MAVFDFDEFFWAPRQAGLSRGGSLTYRKKSLSQMVGGMVKKIKKK